MSDKLTKANTDAHNDTDENPIADVEVSKIVKSKGKTYQEFRVRVWRDRARMSGSRERMDKMGLLTMANLLIDIANATDGPTSYRLIED